MYIYIEIEDLVANALIELVEKKGQREVLFKDLDEYGARVVDVLSSDGETKAVLVVSRESQMVMLEDYTDMFEPFERDGAKGIRLKDGIMPIQLWKRFCASLSLKVLEAFQALATKEAFRQSVSTKSVQIFQDINLYIKIFELACLLHDVGHAPFSHTGESFYLYKGERAKLHEQIIKLTGDTELEKEIIDVDKMDYLIRDSYVTGFDTVSIDYIRLLRSINVVI